MPSEKGLLAFWLVAIVLLGLAARLALFAPEKNFSPDSVDYLNIARNLAEGRGFTHSIKWHFFTDFPVWNSAYGERPPLFPLAAALIWKLGGRLTAICLFNLLCSLGSLVALFFLARTILSHLHAAGLAVLLVALNPSVARAAVYPWTEALFLLLQTAALGLAVLGLQEEEKKTDGKLAGLWEGVGLLTALAYLARPSAVALAGALLVILVVRRQWKGLRRFLWPLALILVVWFGLVWQAKGSPFYSVQSHHFRVQTITDGMRGGWSRDIPSAGEFIRNHPVHRYIANNLWEYGREFFGRHWMGFVALGLFGLVRPPRRGWALLGLCGLFHFLLIGLTWSTHEGDRLLQPTFYCWTVLAVGGGLRFWQTAREGQGLRKKSAWAAVLALLLAGLMQLGWYGEALWKNHQSLSRCPAYPLPNPELQERLRILPVQAVLVTDEPFLANWFLDRPTIYLPRGLKASNFPYFLEEYEPALVVLLNPRDEGLRSQMAELLKAGLLQPFPFREGFGFLWYRPVADFEE